MSYACYEGIQRVDLQLHSLLTSELHGGDWPASFLNRFTSEEETADTDWTES